MSGTIKDIPAKLLAPAIAGGAERIARPAISLWRGAAWSLVRNPLAIICLVVLALIVLGALIIPIIYPLDYAAQDVTFSNQPFFSVSPTTGIMHIFGTDNLGRDTFIRVWYGARVSLVVAGAVALIDCTVGVIYGGISGYCGGRVDNIMMRILEIIGAIPYLIVVLLLMAVLPRGIETIILAYSLVGWTGTARLVRSEVVRLKSSEYMVAARIMGAGVGRTITKHLIPNLMAILIVSITLDIPGIIFTEAFLSLLGLGIAPPYPSWGVLANDAMATFQVYPEQLAIPAIFICVFVLAFNLLGDRLQDAFDPKSGDKR